MMKSATTEAQVEELEKAFTKVVDGLKGSISKVDKWGKLKLAFPIEHKDYAYFVLIRYTLPGDALSEAPKQINHLLQIKLNNTVIRFANVSLTKEAFESPYKKPEPFIPSATPGHGAGRGFFNKGGASVEVPAVDEA